MLSTTQRPGRQADYQFRPLTPDDLVLASELLTQTNHGVPPPALLEDLSRSLARWPSLQVGAFTASERLTGLVAGRVDPSDALLGWSDDIVLRAESRGRGIGGALLTRQLDAFRALGCTRVRGLSPERLFHAIPFFERHGFRVIERTVARGWWGIADGEPLYITECIL